MIKNILLHTKIILKHKKEVFRLSIKAGIPVQGLFHDFSKFHPIEFWESVKFFDGKRSPILKCKEQNGYSKAWMHHKGVNKHHLEYWLDIEKESGLIAIEVPEKIALEICCDVIAASKTYNGVNFTYSLPYEYWNNFMRTKILIHKKTEALISKILKEYIEFGDEVFIIYKKDFYKQDIYISN